MTTISSFLTRSWLKKSWTFYINFFSCSTFRTPNIKIFFVLFPQVPMWKNIGRNFLCNCALCFSNHLPKKSHCHIRYVPRHFYHQPLQCCQGIDHVWHQVTDIVGGSILKQSALQCSPVFRSTMSFKNFTLTWFKKWYTQGESKNTISEIISLFWLTP